MKKENKDTKINIDKTPQVVHHYLTNELIRRNFITDTDFDIFRYDDLFQEVLSDEEFKTVLMAVSYTVSRMKKNKFHDENGREIEYRYAYFREALLSNIRKINMMAYMELFYSDD